MESLQEPPRTGCLARFVNSTFFSIAVVCVILANTAITIYEADTLIQNQSTEPQLARRRFKSCEARRHGFRT